MASSPAENAPVQDMHIPGMIVPLPGDGEGITDVAIVKGDDPGREPSKRSSKLGDEGNDGPNRSVSRSSAGSEAGAEAAQMFKDMSGNTGEVKTRIKSLLSKKVRVATRDLYFEDGIWQKIARHAVFENVTLGVIGANAVWMSIDTDWNKAPTLPEADVIFQLVEHMFCTYFFCELFVRFMALKHKCDGRKDGWFVFDSCLVFLMVGETWVLLIVTGIMGVEARFPLKNAAVLRLFRLLRLSRLIRMLRALPELMVLVKAMITAIRSVFYVLVLLVLVCYVFAIACTQLSVDTAMGQLYFQNVLMSMYSLLVYATFLDNLADFCNAIREESIVVLITVFLFMGLACLTLMNMLLGVLCDVISDVAKSEKTEMQRANIAEKMLAVAMALDTDNSGMVSHKEFEHIFHNIGALRVLEKAGVDPVDVVDASDEMFLNEDGSTEEIPFDTFMEQVFELHSENLATLRDVKYLWSHFMPKLDHLIESVETVKANLTRIDKKLLKTLLDVKLIAHSMG